MSEVMQSERPRSQERTAQDLGGLFYGVYPALVVDADDPEQLGRVKLAIQRYREARRCDE